jgi:hypothetical protein
MPLEENKIMRFNANRLAALAGVTNNNGESQMLSEASNRSMHDDASISDEADYRFGKGQLAEDAHEVDEEADADDDLDEAVSAEDMDEDMGEDEVVEIDEAMLKQEIMRMRSEKKRSMVENQIRSAVRREIQEMLGEDTDIYNKSDWVYGDNKPTRSKKGFVAHGALGVGFK